MMVLQLYTMKMVFPSSGMEDDEASFAVLIFVLGIFLFFLCYYFTILRYEN